MTKAQKTALFLLTIGMLVMIGGVAIHNGRDDQQDTAIAELQEKLSKVVLAEHQLDTFARLIREQDGKRAQQRAYIAEIQERLDSDEFLRSVPRRDRRRTIGSPGVGSSPFGVDDPPEPPVGGVGEPQPTLADPPK